MLRESTSMERAKELCVGSVFQKAATAEVYNSNLWKSTTGLNQNVLWFNVSVDNTSGVKYYQGFNQLPQNDLQTERDGELGEGGHMVVNIYFHKKLSGCEWLG